MQVDKLQFIGEARGCVSTFFEKKVEPKSFTYKGAVKGEARLFLQAKKCPHCQFCIDKV